MLKNPSLFNKYVLNIFRVDERQLNRANKVVPLYDTQFLLNSVVGSYTASKDSYFTSEHLLHFLVSHRSTWVWRYDPSSAWVWRYAPSHIPKVFYVLVFDQTSWNRDQIECHILD